MYCGNHKQLNPRNICSQVSVQLNLKMLPEDVAKAVALHEDGRSVRYIAATLKLARSTVNNATRRYQETGEYSRKKGSGRNRSTTDRDDRFIVSTVLRDRRETGSSVAAQLAQVRGVKISARTVRRRLNEKKLRSRKPATGPVLLPAHRVARLNFAQSHVQWSINDWRAVLFTDESRFSLRSSDGRERVWRRTGERYTDCVLSPRTPFHGRSLMVWAGISLEGRTALVFKNNGTVNAYNYIEDCLSQHVVPYGPFIRDDFVLMHDNAKPHVANVVKKYLREVDINVMDWPARSPYMNPIEHVWDMLGRRIRSRGESIQTLDDLRTALEVEWENLDQNAIANLIESMPQRMNKLYELGDVILDINHKLCFQLYQKIPNNNNVNFFLSYNFIKISFLKPNTSNSLF